MFRQRQCLYLGSPVAFLPPASQLQRGRNSYAMRHKIRSSSRGSSELLCGGNVNSPHKEGVITSCFADYPPGKVCCCTSSTLRRYPPGGVPRTCLKALPSRRDT